MLSDKDTLFLNFVVFSSFFMGFYSNSYAVFFCFFLKNSYVIY